MIMLPKISEFDKYFQGENLLYTALFEVISKSISDNEAAFDEEYLNGSKDLLLANDFIVLAPSGIRYMIKYDNLLVQHVLMRVAESKLHTVIPDNLKDAIRFAKRFREETRLDVRHAWNGQMDTKLEDYVYLYLSSIGKIDIVEMYRTLPSLEEREDEFNVFEWHLSNIFFDLDITLDQVTEVLELLNREQSTSYHTWNLLTGLVKAKPAIALELFDFLKTNEKYELASRLLVDLFPSDESKFLAEAVEIAKSSPEYGIGALAWIKYSSFNQIVDACNTVSNIEITTIEEARTLPAFFAKVIDNPNSDEEIRTHCFDNLKMLISSQEKDGQFRAELVTRVGHIDGFEEEKMQLLSYFYSWGDPNVLRHYFDRFKSPSYLFKVISDAYIAAGRNVKLSMFETPLSIMYHYFEEEFETELLKLLVSDIKILRFGAIQILSSNKKYSVNLLKLNQDQQGIALASICAYPIMIDQILPIIINLKNSPYKEIQQELEEKLIELIQGYEQHLIDQLKLYLDLSVQADIDLFESVSKAFEEYDDIKKRKAAIPELNPFNNDITILEKYYRIEHEYQAEQMNEAQDKSFMRAIGKEFGIVRGMAFKMESRPEISILNPYSSGIHIDRRSYIDADRYFWQVENFFETK